MSEEESVSGPAYILEITQRCNHSCHHCFNVWKLGIDYPRGELDTAGWKTLTGKLKRETNCTLVTLSGGEPLLRADYFEILRYLHSLEIASILITNGTLLNRDYIRECLDLGVTTFELPLLSNRREIHNSLSGVGAAFDKVVTAIAEIKREGGRVVTVFVATRKNIEDFEKTIELAFALGADGLMLNRFNPGGGAVSLMDELMPPVRQLEETLKKAQVLSNKYALSVSCAIPMQPCLFNFEEYPDIGYGFCAAGTERAYYTFDPMGNLRPCNHSSIILGNFLESTLKELLFSNEMKRFAESIPSFCEPCPQRKVCQGGCKAAAQVCYGDTTSEEPYLKMARSELGESFKYPAG